jgi:O-antigen/teichoic acid export membrane protein
VIYVTDLKGNYPAAKVLGLRLMLSAIAITVLLITCFVAGYSLQESEVIFVIGLAQLVDCVSENYFAIAQRHERMDRIAKSQTMRSLLSLSAVASIVYLTHNLLWGVAGYVVARGTVLFTYDAGHGTFTLGSTTRNIPTYAQRLSPQWDFRKQFQLLWVALPLGAVTILGSLNSNMPRYFLEKSDGPREVGIYSALNYLPTAALLISSALGYAAFARLSKLYFEGDLRNFRIVLGKAIAVCASLGVCGLLGGALLGRQVLTLLYRPEYAEHVDLLMLLLTVGAIGCVASCMGCAMSAASQFRVQVPLFLAVTGTSFVACHFLIPRYGLRGGAFASLVAMCVQFLGTAIVIYRALAKRAEEMKVGVAIGIEPALESQ